MSLVVSEEQILRDIFGLPWIPIEGYRGLPVSPGVYFVVSHEDTVLYVGRSQSIRKRWLTHERLQEFLSKPGIRIAWLSVVDIDALPKLEEAYIEHLKPLHNGKRIATAQYDFSMRPATYLLSTFAERLRFRREQSKYSLEDLAQMTLIPFSRLESLEQGSSSEPILSEILSFTRALVVTADWLIGVYKPHENPWPIPPFKA